MRKKREDRKMGLGMSAHGEGVGIGFRKTEKQRWICGREFVRGRREQ